jgi:Nucleotide-diphospho-sugar transferase
MMHSLGISFWWMDADSVVFKDIEPLLHTSDAKASDVIFQLDTCYKISRSQMIRQHHGISLPDQEWAEACAGVFFAKATPATGDLFIR